MITLASTRRFVRRLYNPSLIALGASGVIILASATKVISVFLDELRLFRPVARIDYELEVSSFTTGKLDFPLGILLLAGAAVLLGFVWKKVRIPAIFVSLLLAVPPYFMAESVAALSKQLHSAPYQPQLRLAETFPISSDWERDPTYGTTQEFPEARLSWRAQTPLQELCKNLEVKMSQWADVTTKSSFDESDSESSCLFDGKKGANDVRVIGFPSGDEIAVSVTVTSTVPVVPEDFLVG